MTVSHTSPNGTVTIETITVDGQDYDLPPWISASRFERDLRSKNYFKPLASLTECKLDSWDEAKDHDWYGTDDTTILDMPIFALKFTVPLDRICEIAMEDFTPMRQSEGKYHVEIGASDVTVSLKAFKYRDVTDVQVLVLPMDFASRPYSGPEEIEYFFDELTHDFKRSVEYVKDWEGFYEEFTTPSGEPYFVMIHAHED